MTPPRACSGAMRWIVAQRVHLRDAGPGPGDDATDDRDRAASSRWWMRPSAPCPSVTPTNEQLHRSRAVMTAQHQLGRAVRAATTSAAKRPATTGWVMWMCNCSCRYDGDSPNTQPTTPEAGRAADRVGDERRVGSRGARARSAAARREASARRVGRRLRNAQERRGRAAVARTMSRTYGRHGRPRRRRRERAPLTSGPAVSPAAAATDAASAPPATCCVGCSSADRDRDARHDQAAAEAVDHLAREQPREVLRGGEGDGADDGDRDPGREQRAGGRPGRRPGPKSSRVGISDTT